MKLTSSLYSAILVVCMTTLLTGCAQIAGKRVAGKEPPNILVADDGSICVVSDERFEKTEVGMKALCAWRGGRIPAPVTTTQKRSPSGR